MTSPFDRARYEALLKGLEANEAQFSMIQNGQHSFRFDSEFFRKDWAAAHTYLLNMPNTTPLWRLCEKITQGPNPNFVEEGIACLNGKNIYFGTAAAGEPNYVSPQEFRALEAFSLRPGDILITLKHATKIGRAWIKEDSSPAIFSRNLGLLRPAADGDIRAVPLLFILWARNYQLALDRIATGGTNGQITLATTPLKDLPVSLLSEPLQGKIEATFKMAQHHGQRACSDIKVAEQTLLRALGLEGWQPPELLTYTRRASEAFAAGRLDAEHYKQEFYAAKERLKEAGARGFIPLGELLTAITNGHTPLHHNLTVGEVPFLCAEHVTDFEVHYDSEKRILAEHHQTELSRTALRDGDVLLTIKGRVGNAALAENVPGAVNINQDVALLRFNDRLPVWYVLAYLNSFFGKLQVEQMSTGGINPFLGLSNVRKLQIPEFDERQMEEIGNQTRTQVHKARAAHLEARSLLKRAKCAVEVAIEESEEAALALLNTIEDF